MGRRRELLQGLALRQHLLQQKRCSVCDTVLTNDELDRCPECGADPVSGMALDCTASFNDGAIRFVKL